MKSQKCIDEYIEVGLYKDGRMHLRSRTNGIVTAYSTFVVLISSKNFSADIAECTGLRGLQNVGG